MLLANDVAEMSEEMETERLARDEDDMEEDLESVGLGREQRVAEGEPDMVGVKFGERLNAGLPELDRETPGERETEADTKEVRDTGADLLALAVLQSLGDKGKEGEFPGEKVGTGVPVGRADKLGVGGSVRVGVRVAIDGFGEPEAELDPVAETDAGGEGVAVSGLVADWVREGAGELEGRGDWVPELLMRGEKEEEGHCEIVGEGREEAELTLVSKAEGESTGPEGETVEVTVELAQADVEAKADCEPVPEDSCEGDTKLVREGNGDFETDALDEGDFVICGVREAASVGGAPRLAEGQGDVVREGSGEPEPEGDVDCVSVRVFVSVRVAVAVAVTLLGIEGEGGSEGEDDEDGTAREGDTRLLGLPDCEAPPSPLLVMLTSELLLELGESVGKLAVAEVEGLLVPTRVRLCVLEASGEIVTLGEPVGVDETRPVFELLRAPLSVMLPRGDREAEAEAVEVTVTREDGDAEGEDELLKALEAVKYALVEELNEGGALLVPEGVPVKIVLDGVPLAAPVASALPVTLGEDEEEGVAVGAPVPAADAVP